MAFLKSAKKAGARIDVVNIMVMDDGDSRDMGAAAVSAVPGTLKQLKAVWPASTYANLGITPMIGQNDTSSEVFTYDDAETLVQFARANGVRRLAFWSLNRDQACGPDDTLDSCSGLRQDPLDYTDALRG